MTIKNFINNQDHIPLSGMWLDNYEPATGKIYGEIPNSNEDDVERAVQAAEEAFPAWSQTSIDERSKIMLRIADLIEEELNELAVAESKDNGKPLWLAKAVDIPRASSNFRFYGNAITQYASKSHESVGKNTINFTLRKPIGVVGCISPWNLPLYLFTWKIAPAIAAGNCVIAKPSEVTPATAYLLGKIVERAGLPAGVLNIVHGMGASCGSAIVKHPKIKAISFTGGTTTGAAIAAQAAPMFKKLSLELGGKNPNLIFADCDYEKMLDTTVRSSFANQGQICLCGSRIFVEKKIYERFKSGFETKVKELKVGNPADASTKVGALVSQQHLEKVESYIAFAKANPKEYAILSGGSRVTVKDFEEGYYLEPTVIEVSSNDCKLNQEEIFGPVVTIMPFEDEQEALKLANSTRYGLSSTLWTSDLNRCMRLSNAMESGIVWVNTWLNRDLRTPFGGVKDSGVGREGGFEALDFFTEPKNVCIEYH
ncbi:2-hydroxymuconic semialdehyde dehydrogenase [Nonlabens spongiae]|uniref:2-hydroxymuconic semialdehyde dehydrogenase n=1 Tax=Nonlabens spongiae TaxID=331648 RepID=A0A1W6MMS7_9FLAO|nr:aldehyde dehydrogenase [Nonlabens spongiae]ARN78816.1 2-hydroxymuconic semialdehyde dehydrogenase [Nonlabens spongiae]